MPDRLAAYSIHWSPIDACRLRCSVCNSVKRIEKPIFEFIELCKGKETKICSRSASCERLFSARKIGRYLIEVCHQVAAHAFIGRTETSLGFIERAQAGPLSAKAGGKPLALSPISNRLRAKTIEADLMSRHVPLLRWTPCGASASTARRLSRS